MFNFDAGKLAKGAKEGLQKAEMLGGKLGEAAKTVLQGLKDAEKAPEQLIDTLRKLLAEAKKLPVSSTGDNQVLNACIDKAEKLLASDNITMEAITELIAELGALLKKTPAKEPEQPAGGTAASKPVSKAAPAAAAKVVEEPKGKAVEFTDVDANAYYYEAVQWAVQKGITSGTSDTTFSPDKPCTRAQTIVFLWRAAGSPEPKSKENPFTDVKETANSYKAILWSPRESSPDSALFPHHHS